jgi:hypothetical protein
MDHEYIGYLSTILHAPDPEAHGQVAAINMGPDDLAQWAAKDLDNFGEWKNLPALRKRDDDGVTLTGHFENECRIESMAGDDPRFWVPLGSLDLPDSPFPIDTGQYSIVEITYRCTSDHAHPALAWTYPGGFVHTFLPRTRRWRTVVMAMQHWGQPTQVDALIVRLYSSARSKESMEIQSIRFRAMTLGEEEASQKEGARLRKAEPPQHYPLLDDFLPIGTYMSAETAQRMAERLGVGFSDYWELALQDLVLHRHNCVVLEDFQRLTQSEWSKVVDLATQFGIRLIPTRDMSPADEPGEFEAFVETWVKPVAESPALLAWNLSADPKEEFFPHVMASKAKLAEADPHHPLIALTSNTQGYPLFGPFLAASGASHFQSNSPWHVGDLVRNHLPMAAGQQFWMVAPAFTWASGTPEWTSCAEMRVMLNTAFANGARGWFTYAYHNDPVWLGGSCMRTLTGPFLTFSDLWSELQKGVERLAPLLPLFHHARPADLPDEWFTWSARTGDHYEFPEGIPPASMYRMEGADYDLCFVVSNDVRGISTVDLEISAATLSGREVYDISDFVETNEWKPMKRERHMQMMPGQARIFLIAESKVCSFWRDAIAWRIIQDHRRHAAYYIEVAQAYGHDTSPLETVLAARDEGDLPARLNAMEASEAALHNAIYDDRAITHAHAKLLEVMAAMCACDGALCRLVKRGNLDLASELGEDIIPLARECTNLRLQWLHGGGGKIDKGCQDLARRIVALLEKIRASVAD